MAHLNRDALVDKLCERLAVETGGVDIYKAVIDKMDDADIINRLQRFMRDEAQHCELLARYLDTLGVATRETPSARLARLEGEAYLKLIGEAQTPAQVLNILLTVELMDENGWEMIIDLGRDLHDDELVHTLNAALRDEKEHLRGVRGMLAVMNRTLMTGPAAEEPVST